MKLKDTQTEGAFSYFYLLRRIFKYIKPVLDRVILGFIIAIPVGLLEGIVAYALRPYIDIVISQKNMFLAAIIPVGIVAFAGIQGVLKYLNEYLTTWTSLKITNAVKKDLFHKLVYMDTKFFDENTSGHVLARFLGDPDAASTGIIEQLKTLMSNFFGAAALIIVMLTSAWRLAIVGVVVLLIAFLPILLIRKKIKDVSNQGMVIGGDITTTFNETYNGNKIMTSYSLQEMQKEKFETKIQDSFDLSMSLVKRVGWMSPSMYVIASMGIAIVFYYGTRLILSGQMTVGALASFVTSLLLLYKPIRTMGNTLSGLQTIFVALTRVLELFDVEPELKEAENPVSMPAEINSINFENLCFEYIPGQLVLNNINLQVKKGETLAIVGNSGGGKTTLVNLVPRFYDVLSGSVKINDVDVRDIKLKDLRDAISTVFQDNFLYSGSIKDNIMMGNFGASEEDLRAAVKSAHLEEMLAEMPNGINTLIGERGTNLSGGQRQRVAIARAMIKNSSIVILDEATSALDNESEAIVQKALDNLIQNKTVFVIAHRLSTIKNADRIAVINDGELVELGTHDELLNIPEGHYKHLYEMQFKNAEEITEYAN